MSKGHPGCITLVFAIAPLLLVIAVGYGIARGGIIPPASWAGIETLSFRVLIPATLALAIARSDLSIARYGDFGVALVITLVLLFAVAMMLRLLPHTVLDNPSFTSLFQTGARWNAFVALAAAEQFLSGGIALLAVAIAVLIPLINVICILVLASFGPARPSLGKVIGTLVRNPLIQACVAGLIINVSGVSLPPAIVATLDMIGRAALGVGLMAVGAGISLRRLVRVDWRVVPGIAMRPFASTGLFVAVGSAMQLEPVQIFAGVLVFAAPAASNGYIVAKQMGSDANLYADVMTWQVALSLIVLPFWASILL
ncbi:AEC family transporter [uncultured Sulfitobacter sp.]|uniref:AEC family transporter n=1 Tax=uncultured Sulfitobacter sp. TaxID=191468 RepID=UPI002638460C|nr:AEC family transporter [uncultured Sulfitobacter sp.]